MDAHEEFQNMTLVQKINTIDKVIDEKIRGFLHQDNGDLELINVVEKNDSLIVYVEYQGACVSCDSAGNTHQSIENILQRMLAPNIKVLAI